jgi:hypothetical protein
MVLQPASVPNTPPKNNVANSVAKILLIILGLLSKKTRLMQTDELAKLLTYRSFPDSDLCAIAHNGQEVGAIMQLIALLAAQRPDVAGAQQFARIKTLRRAGRTGRAA